MSDEKPPSTFDVMQRPHATVIPIRPGIVRDPTADEALADLPQKGHLGEGMRCYGHHSFVIDADARLVTCAKCSKSFDPYDALALLSREPERWKWLHANIKELHAEIEELKRVRDNLRAQVGRARKKVGEQ